MDNDKSLIIVLNEMNWNEMQAHIFLFCVCGYLEYPLEKTCKSALKGLEGGDRRLENNTTPSSYWN